MAFFAAQQLASLGLAPQVIDAHEVRHLAHRPRQKSDRRDARELCEGIRRDRYRTRVRVPDALHAQLRATLSRRRHFVRLRSAQLTAVKHLLRAAGQRTLTRTLTTPAAWVRLAEAVRDWPDLAAFVAQHAAMWACAAQQVAQLEQRLAEHAAPLAATLARLQTVPGIGPVGATTTIAVLGDVRRFPSAKHVASYIGVVPTTYQSGTRAAQGHITKQGSRELRMLLVEAAHHAGRPTSPFHPIFAPLCAKHGRKKAIVALAHRLLRILYALLRDATAFDLARLGVEAGAFTTRKTVAYRRVPRPTPA
jgi:transposase